MIKPRVFRQRLGFRFLLISRIVVVSFEVNWAVVGGVECWVRSMLAAATTDEKEISVRPTDKSLIGYNTPTKIQTKPPSLLCLRNHDWRPLDELLVIRNRSPRWSVEQNHISTLRTRVR